MRSIGAAVFSERTTVRKAVGSHRLRSRHERFFCFIFLRRISANSAMQGGTKCRVVKKERVYETKVVLFNDTPVLKNKEKPIKN